MDLLDDSGDETNAGRMVAEVDENILLNSDDEEGSPMKAHNNHVGVDEEELLYEGDDDEYLEDDPEDVLDLELGEDELETPDSTLGHIAVKLRPAFDESHAIYETGEGDQGKLEVEDETGVTSTEDHVVSESPSSSRVKPTADSDDDEDSPRQRTRFLTERKTEDISKHSGPSEGNPITTLGNSLLALLEKLILKYEYYEC
ncbi:unnamed protein product [Allacma fusca]|uniref:Uncharacterized protein n=1 Tax=Allacma fusca TaxID=39272 RepID=A0A8J2JJP9_9HEXA|nr:unnamed protein product [Allacma fusca]